METQVTFTEIVERGLLADRSNAIADESGQKFLSSSCDKIRAEIIRLLASGESKDSLMQKLEAVRAKEEETYPNSPNLDWLEGFLEDLWLDRIQ